MLFHKGSAIFSRDKQGPFSLIINYPNTKTKLGPLNKHLMTEEKYFLRSQKPQVDSTLKESLTSNFHRKRWCCEMAVKHCVVHCRAISFHSSQSCNFHSTCMAHPRSVPEMLLGAAALQIRVMCPPSLR